MVDAIFGSVLQILKTSSCGLEQVLGMLGDVTDKRVVELGAGIGRFTGALAATARSVLAVDFMDNLIAENRRTNRNRCIFNRHFQSQLNAR